VKLAKLNALHIEGMVADMQREKVAPWTVRHAATVLHTALIYAVKLKLISANPAAAVQKPGVTAKEMLFLDDDQSKRLLAAAKGQQSYPLLVAALGTGCRQGELLGLGGTTST
jgi:integrase